MNLTYARLELPPQPARVRAAAATATARLGFPWNFIVFRPPESVNRDTDVGSRAEESKRPRQVFSRRINERLSSTLLQRQMESAQGKKRMLSPLVRGGGDAFDYDRIESSALLDEDFGEGAFLAEEDCLEANKLKEGEEHGDKRTRCF